MQHVDFAILNVKYNATSYTEIKIVGIQNYSSFIFNNKSKLHFSFF